MANKVFDKFGWCSNPVRKITKSKINRNFKKLSDSDIELLNIIVNRFENEVESILRNDKYYSKRTIESYKKIKESVKRIQSMIDVGTDGNVDLIRKEW